MGNYPLTGGLLFYRSDDIHCSLGLTALCHLGYPISNSIENVITQATNIWVEYFCGTWWKGNEDAAQALDKTHKRRSPHWIKSFAEGILLGLLSERYDDIAKVCMWVEAGLKHEYTEDFEDELVGVYKSLAAGLRSEPMRGIEKVESTIEKCRTMRPKLLFRAWKAARDGDQDAFNTWFVKSLEHFAANYGSGPTPIYWIAHHQSVVALAAKRLGMKLPDLPPKLEAVLISRESLGLTRS